MLRLLVEEHYYATRHNRENEEKENSTAIFKNDGSSYWHFPVSH